MEPLPWYRIAAAPVCIAALVVYTVLRPSTRALCTVLGAGLLTGYGMAQDQISARLCPEYFTVLHNPIPGLTDPTLLGLAWGFLGAAGGGVAMGYAVGLTATVGRNPQLTVRELLRPMLALVAAVAGVTTITGLSAYRHADMFAIRLDPVLDSRVPTTRHHELFAVASYHLAAYLSAVIGSVILCAWVVRERSRRAAPDATRPVG